MVHTKHIHFLSVILTISLLKISRIYGSHYGHSTMIKLVQMVHTNQKNILNRKTSYSKQRNAHRMVDTLGFPRHTPVIIYFTTIFHEINHSVSWGYPSLWTPCIYVYIYIYTHTHIHTCTCRCKTLETYATFPPASP